MVMFYYKGLLSMHKSFIKKVFCCSALFISFYIKLNANDYTQFENSFFNMPSFLTCPEGNSLCNQDEAVIGSLIHYNLENITSDIDYGSPTTMAYGNTMYVTNLNAGPKVGLKSFSGKNLVIENSNFNHLNSGGSSDLSFGNGPTTVVENLIIINSSGIKFKSNEISIDNVYLYNVDGAVVLPYRGDPVLNVYSYAESGHQNELSTGSTSNTYYSSSNALKEFYVIGDLKYRTHTVYQGPRSFYVGGSMKLDGKLTLASTNWFTFKSGSSLEIYIDDNDRKFTGTHGTLTSGITYDLEGISSRKNALDFANGANITVYLPIKSMFNKNTVSYELINAHYINNVQSINYTLPAWYDVSFDIVEYNQNASVKSNSLILSSTYNSSAKKQALNSCSAGVCQDEDARAIANYYANLADKYLNDNSSLTDEQIETLINLEMHSSIASSVDANGNMVTSLEQSAINFYSQLSLQLPLHSEVYVDQVLTNSYKFMKNLSSKGSIVDLKEGISVSAGMHDYKTYDNFYSTTYETSYQGGIAKINIPSSDKESTKYISIGYYDGVTENRLFSIKETGFVGSFNYLSRLNYSMFSKVAKDYFELSLSYGFNTYTTEKNTYDVNYSSNAIIGKTRLEYGTYFANKYYDFEIGYFFEPLMLRLGEYEEQGSDANYRVEANDIPGYRLGVKSYIGKKYVTNYGTFTPSIFVELGNLKLNENSSNATLINGSNADESLPSTVKTKNDETNDLELYLEGSLQAGYGSFAIKGTINYNSVLLSDFDAKTKLNDINSSLQLKYFF